MTKPAREAIEKAGTEAFAAFLDEYRIRAQNPGAGPASTRDWLEEACGRYRETFLSALTVAGIGTYDTATHAAVPREQVEWQPIETAPRDGTSFLACSSASSVFLAHWANGVVDDSSYSDDTGYLERYATDWQHLPAPVTAAGYVVSPRRQPSNLYRRRTNMVTATQWEGPESCTIQTIAGGEVCLPGSWIVETTPGTRIVFTDPEFRAAYEAAEAEAKGGSDVA